MNGNAAASLIIKEYMIETLGMDYPRADVPDWVMTELGPLVAKGRPH